MSEHNGLLKCAAYEDWARTKEKVDDMHEAMTEYLPHLKKLEKLESIAVSNNDIRDRLISPATSTGRIEVKVVTPIIYTLCFMLIAMVVWFTGVEPNLPNRGNGHQGENK